MHGTDRTLRPELGVGGKQTHKDVYDPSTGRTKRVPVDGAGVEVGGAATPSTPSVAYPGNDIHVGGPVAEVIDLPVEHQRDRAEAS